MATPPITLSKEEIAMEFCPTCEKRMVLSRTKNGPVFICPVCKCKKSTDSSATAKAVVSKKPRETIVVIGKEDQGLKTNPTAQVACPKCKNSQLSRQVSLFAVTGKAKEDSCTDDLCLDESKMEKAMQLIAKEAENMNEDDPRQAAQLMRKLSNMTGLELGPGMAQALDRMEKGEDPDQLEAEMGDILNNEEPFILPEKKQIKQKLSLLTPQRDDTLYDL